MSCNCNKPCACDGTQITVGDPSYETPTSTLDPALFPYGCSGDNAVWEWGTTDTFIIPAEGAQASLRVCSCKFAVNQTIWLQGSQIVELTIDQVEAQPDGSCLLTVVTTDNPNNPDEGEAVTGPGRVWHVKPYFDYGMCSENIPPIETGKLLVVVNPDPCDCDADDAMCAKTFYPQDPDGEHPDDNPACGMIWIKEGDAYVLRKAETAVDGSSNPTDLTHLTGFVDGQCRPYTVQGEAGVSGLWHWTGTVFEPLAVPGADPAKYELGLNGSGEPTWIDKTPVPEPPSVYSTKINYEDGVAPEDAWQEATERLFFSATIYNEVGLTDEHYLQLWIAINAAGGSAYLVTQSQVDFVNDPVAGHAFPSNLIHSMSGIIPKGSWWKYKTDLSSAGTSFLHTIPI
jgi:hypothetical protein